MGRIASAFKRLGKINEKALVPYVTVGYPTLEQTRQLVPVIARQGADLIELGIPFSDPMADGATIQRASHIALEQGVTIDDCMAVAAEARRANEIPLLFMSYYNPIHSYGLQRFAQNAAASGVDGLIVPDLPPEEASELKAACEVAGVDLIFLVAPTSTDARLQRVVEMASGFIYCVSIAGVTGARSELGPQAEELVNRVRQFTDLPLVVGFGISTPEQVSQVTDFADGAVVASALLNAMEGVDEEEIIGVVGQFVRELKAGTAK